MSTSDGAVIGTTQIFGSSPRNRAFNVVLLAEGFTNTQQNDFNNACTASVNAFFEPRRRSTSWAPRSTFFASTFVRLTRVPTTRPGLAVRVRGVSHLFHAAFGANNIRRLLVCNTRDRASGSCRASARVHRRTRCSQLDSLRRQWWILRAPIHWRTVQTRLPSMKWGTLPSASPTNTCFTPGAMRRVMITIHRASRPT